MQLRSLADADLAALLAAIDGLSVAEVREALIVAVPELVAPYTAASGELAAVLFEDLRAEAGRRGTFYAEVAATVPAPARVEATARWAVAPLSDEALNATVLSRMSGSVSRMIMGASRDTMETNGARESVRFQRMARPGACAFCGMLASRPPWMSYRSSESAGGVVGRGSTRTGLDADGNRLSGGIGGGIRARGNQSIGSDYHDDCRCVVMPLYQGTEMAQLARVEREAWEQKYAAALPEDRSSRMSLAEMDAAIRRGESVVERRDTKAILANWRKVHGTR